MLWENGERNFRENHPGVWGSSWSNEVDQRKSIFVSGRKKYVLDKDFIGLQHADGVQQCGSSLEGPVNWELAFYGIQLLGRYTESRLEGRRGQTRKRKVLILVRTRTEFD